MKFSKFLKPALALAGLLMAQSAFAGHFLYTGGHSLDPQRLSQLGFSSNEFYADDNGWAQALSGNLGQFDAIVIGESQPGISGTTATNIKNFVANGGRLVVVGNHSGSTDITNLITGYGIIAAYGCKASANIIAGTLQAAAANGTAFLSGSANLRTLSCTGAIDRTSLPTGAKSIYSGTGTSAAFTTKIGRGQFAWLGWDYCCGATNYENDWYHVLATAVSPNFKVCAGAGYAGAKLVLCQQICEVRQSTSVMTTLTKAFSTLYHSAPSCTAELSASQNPFPF